MFKEFISFIDDRVTISETIKVKIFNKFLAIFISENFSLFPFSFSPEILVYSDSKCISLSLLSLFGKIELLIMVVDLSLLFKLFGLEIKILFQILYFLELQ